MLARVSGNKARGHALVTGPGGSIESETFTCAHCNGGTVMPRNAGEDIAGKMCGPCHAMICARCAKTGVCEPFEKVLLKMEAEARQRASLFAAMGF